jgi:4-hydroxy-tetrahydrodipicolinate synthase
VLGVTNGRVPVVVGVIGQATEAERIDQIRISRDLGAAAVVLNIAEWATHDETDDVLVDRLENLAERVRGVDFGLYECPVPYHRLLGVDTVGRIARTGRFTFFKETSSNIDSLAGKINVSRGTRLRVYNANAELLSAAMMLGAAGYSGIEANYCPALCAWLCRNADSGSRAERVQHLITMLHNDRIQRKYPTITKAFMELDGLPIDSACRSQRYQLDDFDYDAIRAYKQQFDQMKRELASHALIPVMTKRKPSSGNVPAG